MKHNVVVSLYIANTKTNENFTLNLDFTCTTEDIFVLLQATLKNLINTKGRYSLVSDTYTPFLKRLQGNVENQTNFKVTDAAHGIEADWNDWTDMKDIDNEFLLMNRIERLSNDAQRICMYTGNVRLRFKDDDKSLTVCGGPIGDESLIVDTTCTASSVRWSDENFRGRFFIMIPRTRGDVNHVHADLYTIRKTDDNTMPQYAVKQITRGQIRTIRNRITLDTIEWESRENVLSSIHRQDVDTRKDLRVDEFEAKKTSLLAGIVFITDCGDFQLLSYYCV